jgi:plasmid maintenance system antidote protein VapI
MDEERLPSVHPGEILRLEFLEPPGITPYRTPFCLNLQARQERKER